MQRLRSRYCGLVKHHWGDVICCVSHAWPIKSRLTRQTLQLAELQAGPLMLLAAGNTRGGSFLSMLLSHVAKWAIKAAVALQRNCHRLQVNVDACSSGGEGGSEGGLTATPADARQAAEVGN